MKSLVNGILFTLLLTQICFAQWFWQNPLPQGNSLTKIFVLDSTHAWASGNFGALIYTVNGADWNSCQGLQSDDNLGGIFFISSEVGWIVTNSSDKVYRTTNGGNSWEPISSLGFNLNQIYFFDESNGILTGTGHIAKSLDGGLSWQNVYDLNGLGFKDISFVDNNIGWVSTSTNKILHTNDGGINWEMQTAGESNAIIAMQFTSDSIGWAAAGSSSGDIILKTSNGGEDWNQLSFDPPGDITSIFYLNDSTGWVNTSIYGRIFKTTNSGLTFNQISSVANFNSMWFDENQNGWGADKLGRVLFSQDGGYNWTVQTDGIHRSITGTSFIDSSKGFATTFGYILKTTNSGVSWETDLWDDTYWFYDIDFYDSLNGIAVGWCDETFNCSGGIIFKTTNGGEDWDNVYPGGYFDVYGFYSYYYMSKDTGYIGGRDYILKTTNGGDSWNEYYLGSFGEINDIFFIDSLMGWAVGYPTIILKTTDGGSTWNTITYETDFRNYRNVLFLNHNVGFITGLENDLLKSTDGGLTWFETVYPADDIMFADSINGWLLGSNGMYRTTNSGISWQFIAEAPTNFHLTEMEAKSNKYFWVAGANGIILKYTDSTLTTIQESPYLIRDYHLLQNYPNPFNPSTKIKYSIPQQSNVLIKVFDILGNEIETLINEEKPAGTYELTWNAANLPSGVYFYQLRAGGFIQTKKMLLLK